jgi:hypothetical protein
MAKSKLENKNPPRRTTIRGQDHLLAYITPEEAQLLMDNGGTGEAGPMGIPTFIPDDGNRGGGSNREGPSRDGPKGAGKPGGTGGKSTPGGAPGGSKGSEKGAVDPGLAKAAAQKAAQQAAADKAAGEAARQRIAAANAKVAEEAAAKRAAQQAAGLMQSFDDTDYGAATKAQLEAAGQRALAGLTDEQYKAMPGYMKAVYDTTGAYNFDIDPTTQRVLGFTGPSVLGFTPGIAGLLTSLMPEPTTEAELRGVYTGFGRMGDRMGPQGDGREVVQAQTNPVTGEQNQCPDGYIFDEDLQACRVSAGLPSGFGTVPDTGPYQPGTYARMGLLDVAPTGLEQFASTYGTGFGTAPDYEAANLRYRKQAGTTPQIFQDPYNLPGYTLLS